MSKFQCACGYITDRRDSYNKHIRSKRSCMSRKDVDALINKVKILKQQISSMTINNNSIIIKGNNNGTVNNNITINVVSINPFGKENVEYLADQIIKRCLESGVTQAHSNLVKQIHCNPEYPENMNVYIPNLRSKYAKVYDGKRFVTKLKKDVVDTVRDNTDNLMTEYVDEQPNLTYRQQTDYNRVLEGTYDESGKYVQDIRDHIECELYNVKDTMLKTQWNRA